MGRRIQAKLIAENRRFSVRLGQKRRREAALQRRVLRKIHRLVHELKMEQSGIKKFAIQQKLILHLRRLYSCGKLQKLARKERKYSFLLRREGRRLENLVHKLYTVEGKVSHFSKTLRKHHAKWE